MEESEILATKKRKNKPANNHRSLITDHRLLVIGHSQLVYLSPFFLFLLFNPLNFAIIITDKRMPPYSGENRLTRQQKTGFGLLLVFGILAIGLGFLQMRNTIYLPFVVRAKDNAAVNINSFFDEQTKLQQIDTDQDGLNDYEELAFYETSPYLPDTDSDGIEDKVELEQDTDPLCPEGRECAVEVQRTPASTSSLFITPESGLTTPIDIINNAAVAAQVDSQDSGLDIGSIVGNPDLIREILLKTGNITKEQLAGIDDETLLKLAQEALRSGALNKNESKAGEE